MPSPFPGMDPYLESQVWEDFHHDYISEIRGALMPGLGEKYVARIQQRVYLEHAPDSQARTIKPDVAVVREPEPAVHRGQGAPTISPPLGIPLLMPEEIREAYVEVRLLDGEQVVTVIEILSPTNKRSGTDGRREYLTKREGVLRSGVLFVEVDLLRGGERMPMARPFPPMDYYALVSRAQRRPTAEVWPFTLRDPLPVIPIPLADQDPDIPLDLQGTFTAVHDRARYDRSPGYERGTTPPLNPEDADWARALLERWRESR